MSLLVYTTGLNKLFNVENFPAIESLKDTSYANSIIFIECDGTDLITFGNEYEEGNSYVWAQGQLIGRNQVHNEYITGLNTVFNADGFPGVTSLKNSNKKYHVLYIKCDANDKDIFGNEYEEGKMFIWTNGIFIGSAIKDPAELHDATLSDIKINGETIEGFSSAIYSYTYIVPAGQSIPNVTATATQDAAIVDITQSHTFNDPATIVVTAPDGITTLSYTISMLDGGTKHNYIFNPSEQIGVLVPSTTENMSWTIKDESANDVTINMIGNKKAWQIKNGSSKTWQIDGITYSYTSSYYLYYSGAGTVSATSLSCVLELPIEGDCEIIIAASAGAAGRYLNVYNDYTLLKSNVCTVTTGGTIVTDSITYSGPSTILRIISGSSGVDLYMVKIKYNS